MVDLGTNSLIDLSKIPTIKQVFIDAPKFLYKEPCFQHETRVWGIPC